MIVYLSKFIVMCQYGYFLSQKKAPCGAFIIILDVISIRRQLARVLVLELVTQLDLLTVALMALVA
jgi:hypothetical protein